MELRFSWRACSTAKDVVVTSILPTMTTRQLVLQPSEGPKKHAALDFDRSVRRGLRLVEHAAVLGDDLVALKALYPDGVAKLWGSAPTESASNTKAAPHKRRVGDRVLFYAGNAFFAEATVLHLFDNATAAKSLWGTDEDGTTWQHIMALGEVREFEQPVPVEDVLTPLDIPIPLRGTTLLSAAEHAKLPDLAAHSGMPSRHWVLQCNPKTWDIWTWWENGAEELNGWAVAKHLRDLRTGDRFALWVSGQGAGAYLLGTLTSAPRMTTEFDEYWTEPPDQAHVVGVRCDRYLFENPITKHALASDPIFAKALIMRMPGYGNPIPLTPDQWRVIEEAAARQGSEQPMASSRTVVTSRPLAEVPEESTATTVAGPKAVVFPEAKLVKQYKDSLGRELRCLAALLPSGERLVCDAYDPEVNMIIEAKASNSRPDVRMALGQLLDYQQHIKPDAALAVLLPAKPSETAIDLLRAYDVKLIYRDGRSFHGPA